MLQEYENKYSEREEKEEMFAKEKGGLIYQVASVYSNVGTTGFSLRHYEL